MLLSAQCVHIPNRGFRRGSYRCDCPPSQLNSASTHALNGSGWAAAADESSLDGVELERAYVDNLLSGAFGAPVTCPRCERACMAEYDPLLRGIPLGVQTLCITVTIVLTVVIVRLRKTKVFNSFIYLFNIPTNTYTTEQKQDSKTTRQK